ncbi:MAG: hypothetical protein HC892_16465 [Saprospiraceae bacterium]|nr:hypothetical protein [Saprospiraceae bacterium]
MQATKCKLKVSTRILSIQKILMFTTDIKGSSRFEYVGHKGTKDARSIIKVKVQYGGFQLEN